MTSANFDVVIVGAGAAGLTAAIGLARAGFRVAAVEAAAFPGAENWSGCVYFAENLAHPDILGPEGVEALAWERRLVERGFFGTDGYGLLGLKYRDPDAFRHCYTVLRPIYDYHLAQLALRHGVALLTSTTAESLIREQGRVIGICTNRGPLYAHLTFLAEGDASHLVTREGYEGSDRPEDAPKFLQGIKQVLELPPRAIELRFGVGPEEGVAYEMLLRNGSLRGQSVHLNMGGFLYTNRQSLSIGLVLPADHLHQHFEGDPNLLMEWFLGLPALAPWFAGATHGPFGAKLIRGGGIKEVPTLIDDGLAIGGAASGIGIDFPYPNFTGPATAMGLLLTQAARKIRAEGGAFDRAALARHYLEPLRQTHYYHDVEFLRDWPGYVKKTSVFFGRHLDVALGSAYLWTRPGKGLSGHCSEWWQLVEAMTAGEQREELAEDFEHLTRALHVPEVAPRPSPWRLLLDGALNLFRDMLGVERGLPGHGDIALHYSIAGGAEPSGLPPATLRTWFARFGPAIAAAARLVYRNDTMPLAQKLPAATRVLTRYVSLLDLARAIGWGLVGGLQWLRRKRHVNSGAASTYSERARQATDLTPVVARATAAWETRLAQLTYETTKDSHIHVLWPQALPDKNAITQAGLWHVCPAHVYEARVSASGQAQVVVNFENCIKCETCWRTSDVVDWGRDGAQRFVYAVHSPVTAKLLGDMDRAGAVRPAQPYPPAADGAVGPLDATLAKLEGKLRDLERALAEEPRTIDRDRAAYLEMLARYSHQLALVSRDTERSAGERADEFTALTRRLVERVRAQRYAWAAADARHIRWHYLAAPSHCPQPPAAPRPNLAQRLDALLPAALWRDLGQYKLLTPQQDAGLRALVAATSERRPLLAELAGRDPSLAYRVAHYYWARSLTPEIGDKWGCVAAVDEHGEALLVPALQAEAIVVVRGNEVHVHRAADVAVEPLKTLGLRGAGLARVRAEPSAPGPTDAVPLSLSADLVAMAHGMADYLCRRAIEHATSRVQFPGLFHDDEARDPIGKFGAVKKMIAEMAAGRLLIASVNRPWPAAAALLVKAVVAEVLGTAPGSISYNAGQVFGGTGYSEDDTLSKFYRDAAAWRFLGVGNAAIYAAHGAALLDSWSAGDDPLQRFPNEESLFADIQQRQAVHAEAQQIRKCAAVVRERIQAWKFATDTLPSATAVAAIQEAAARQDALLLVSKALLFHVHDVLESGAGEIEVALLRVWLSMLREAHDDFLNLVAACSRRDVAPPLLDGQPLAKYADFQGADLPYSSGDFLHRPTNPDEPRYVPEMIETDEILAQRNRELIDLIKGQFGAPRQGLVFERYLEEQHRPDAADLDFLREQGFFRVPIPKELGGEGRSKADYYLLTVNTHRLADAAISLTIQVNSSLGTTPVLLPREKELPKAQKDLTAFVADTPLHQEIARYLQEDSPGAPPAGLEAVLSKPVLRVHAHHFVQAWQDVKRATKALDASLAQAKLREARVAWQVACATAPEYLDEIGRRREAADLFCRWVARGQISAFALTEPSAGSDTARVATRAKLRQVPLEAEADGVYRFVPAGGKEPRRLLDARRLEFSVDAEPQAVYRYSDAAEAAPIQFDEYDYETDACKKRYFVAGGRRVYFDDIAQIRERHGKLWYDYWELTGAKMWITNGRVMGVMALYAKTEEGVTGFMVDRHAEGLIVGKDEAKMGQNGSPTNELALQSVRVPRENVIGLEGRGQVNALETLNVGRAGLAMSAMSQMLYLCQWSRDFAKARHGDDLPAWMGWRLEQLEQERFIAEALSYAIIGRFEHKQTKSVRMESAVGKMLVSELFHHSIELAEEIHGPLGQTQEHLIEKRKRDARILNIYEGTNEIQRFLILRELTEMAAGWGEAPHPRPLSPQAGRGEAEEIDALKARFRQLTKEAVQYFGQQLWQNPNLQADCFVLSEAAGWLAASETALGRVTWLRRQPGSETDLMAIGQRALQRCQAEVKVRLERFAVDLTRLRQGHYAPAIRAASLLFQRKEMPAPALPAPHSIIDRALSILVVLDPPTPGVPQPRTHAGHVVEPCRVLTESDRAALETALRLRQEGSVQIQVATAAPAAAATLLREALSLGIERVRLVQTEGVVAPDRAAAALAETLRGDATFDLILGGAAADDSQEGLLARLTAEALGVPCVGSALQLAVDTSGAALLLVDAEGNTRQRTLPGAVMMEPGIPLRPFTTTGWLCGLQKQVEIVPRPDSVLAATLAFEEAASAAAPADGEKPPQPLLPREASRLVLQSAGVEVATPTRHGTAASLHGSMPNIVDAAAPFFAHNHGTVIVAVLATDADGKLRPTARRTLDAAQFLTPFFDGASKAVLMLVPRRAEAQERALAEIADLTPFDICLLAADGLEMSDEVRCRILAECWSGLENFPVAVVGEPWSEPALARLACTSGNVDPIALRVRLLDRHQGGLAAEGACAKGKLRTRQVLMPAAGQTVWIGMTAEAEVGAAAPPERRPQRRLERWSPRLERFYGQADMQRLLQELKQDTGLVRLSDAEFIIDVGFGVGNRDGYEEVIEPLERELRRLQVRGLVIGGSRKVTEELHLLPADRQIGQSGVSVNPRILLAIGISGAPQHLNYIGPRATILAFNRDPEAPLMTLNQRQARPRVYPIIGDLFETVPALVACLREERADAPVERVRESAAF
jgi:alkylation response protein AidB-like acyl-CoA dehydrogenase/flavin-dependent dehydrogenase/ferredoxin-like protein FixX